MRTKGRTGRRRVVGAMMVAVAVSLGGCGDDGGDQSGEGVDNVQEQARQAAESALAAARDTWAALRTDAERLVDDIQTRNDPAAKERLLERCRDGLEKLRQANSADADRADQLCNRIRDTDVNNRDAWSDIKTQINEIKPGQ